MLIDALAFALCALQDPLTDWLSKVPKDARESIEKEIARFDAAEAADEAKFRPQEFEIGSKLGPHPYETIVPVLIAAIEKGSSPKRRFALSTIRGKMTMRGSVGEADLAMHNVVLVRGLLPAADDPDLRVRRWVGDILIEIADGDVLATEPPKTLAPGEKLRGELTKAFAKIAQDKNPRVRSDAELGASLLADDAIGRLRVRAEVDHYLQHIQLEDASFPDTPVGESKKIRDGIKAAVEKVDDALVMTIACQPGKGSETARQLTLFFRMRDGEWVESLKDPRKKKP